MARWICTTFLLLSILACGAAPGPVPLSAEDRQSLVTVRDLSRLGLKAANPEIVPQWSKTLLPDGSYELSYRYDDHKSALLIHSKLWVKTNEADAALVFEGAMSSLGALTDAKEAAHLLSLSTPSKCQVFGTNQGHICVLRVGNSVLVSLVDGFSVPTTDSPLNNLYAPEVKLLETYTPTGAP